MRRQLHRAWVAGFRLRPGRALVASLIAVSGVALWSFLTVPVGAAGAVTAVPAPAGTQPAGQREFQGDPDEAAGEPARSPLRPAVVIRADGAVENFMRDSILSRLDRAREQGAEVVILELNTYGGLVTAAIDISRDLKRADDLHIICFVNEKAISAGAMIAVASDEIVMEPGSLIGDSGVIAAGPAGPQEMDDVSRAKGESLVLAEFRDSALRNNYDPLLIESMIIVERTVYYIEHVETGERRFVEEAEYNRLTGVGVFGRAAEDAEWRDVEGVPVPVDGPRTLLTLNDRDAQAVGLSTGSYRTIDELARARGLDVIAVLRPSTGERMIGFLNNFAVRGILMTVLFLAVYMSLSSPGTGLPEIVAVLLLGVLFGVPFLSGYAQWYEIALVLLGLALLAVEVFVLPGFGIAGITGLLAMMLGLALTFVPPIAMPDFPIGYGVDWSYLGYGLLTVLAGLASSLLLWMWLGRYLPKLPYARGLILTDEPVTPDEAAIEAARSVVWPSPGAVGWAVSDLRPGGTAKFPITDDPDDTANADVVSDRGFVPSGTQLRVAEVHGNRVVVRPVRGEGGALG